MIKKRSLGNSAFWQETAAACTRAGYDVCGLPFAVQSALRHSEPLNEKVVPLVFALNQAGFTTKLSGDFYGDDLVYVDLDLAAAECASNADLPTGWRLFTSLERWIEAATILGQFKGMWRIAPSLPAPLESKDLVRLVRAGKRVSADEAKLVVNALIVGRSKVVTCS